jgi:hypothetical protein
VSTAKPVADADWRLRLEEGRALVRLAAPIALIALVNMGMSVTDAVMVSALFGTDAFAAVAVGSDLYSIIFYLGAGILGGITPFYTAAVTRADKDERARLERIGWMMVGLLAALTVPLVWLAPIWLERFGLDPGLLAQGQGYTRAMALTLIPMLGVMLYRTILTAAEKPKVFLKVTLAMLPLNAVANYVLMTGADPFPALDRAAGLSSTPSGSPCPAFPSDSEGEAVRDGAPRTQESELRDASTLRRATGSTRQVSQRTCHLITMQGQGSARSRLNVCAKCVFQERHPWLAGHSRPMRSRSLRKSTSELPELPRSALRRTGQMCQEPEIVEHDWSDGSSQAKHLCACSP